jgi:flagellar biosynthesis protein FlhG
LSKHLPDQADGLRKLAGQHSLQIISIVSGCEDAGKTMTATNLACALSHAGRVVKVVGTPGDIQWDIQPSSILPARASAPGNWQEALPDIVLIDLPSGTQCDFQDIDRTEVVIIMQPDPQSITSGYGVLKQLSGKYGIDRFHVLLNRITDEADGMTIANNFSAAAGRFLGVSVHYLGYVPRDPQLEKAMRLNKSVIDAFPVARSSTHFRRLADRLITLPRLSGLYEMGEAMQGTVMGATG